MIPIEFSHVPCPGRHLLGASEGLDALLADSKGIEEEKAGTERWITGIHDCRA